MCRLKSAIVLKNRIFVPDYDSHTEMLEELGIEDNYLNASKTFVRVELSPENGDVFSDIATWELDVDQDIIPDWFDKKTYKPQIVEAIKGWAKDHIHIGIDNLEIHSGKNHCIKDCTNVSICGSATVDIICGSSTVKDIYNSATVKTICGSTTVKYIRGCSMVENIYGSATVENIRDYAVVGDIFGDAVVGDIFGDATVENIYGSATVENIRDYAVVGDIWGHATVAKANGSCVIIGSGSGWEKKRHIDSC